MLVSLALMNWLMSGFQASNVCSLLNKATSSSATVLLYVADTDAGTFCFFLLLRPLSMKKEKFLRGT